MAQAPDAGERFRINTPRVSHETVDNETLIIDLDSGNYYSLLGVGAGIWGLIDRGASVGAILDAVQTRYDGAVEQMESAVWGFLAELQKEKLIVPLDAACSAPDRQADAAVGNGAAARVAFEPPLLNRHTDIQDLLLLCPVHDVDETTWPAPKSPTGD